MPIIRRSCRLQSCWFIVINAAAESTAEKYLLIHLTVNEERILESYFYNAVVQQMPHCMDTVLAALKNRTIRCSFCNETLLDYIGNLADDFCTMHLSAMFESKEAFIEKCIEAVCSHYIILCGAKGNFELALGDINYYLGVCEKAAKRRRIKRRSDEIYLGNLPFPEELSRSFSELLFIVSDMFGYLPLKLQADENGRF
jgi:hypothetical protein